MVGTRRTSKARSGSSALAALTVASVSTQMELMAREAAVQSSECREHLHCCPEGRVRNGQGCTLCSLVEVLLQQVAELQEAVTRLKGAKEAEGKQHCLLRDQTVPGPRASTVTRAGKDAVNPGSWETAKISTNLDRENVRSLHMPCVAKMKNTVLESSVSDDGDDSFDLAESFKHQYHSRKIDGWIGSSVVLRRVIST
ncbi:hypothetical protein AAES_05357 [Amazona aestiva]|uniref:Uncharacterized protein n=1 Tax=Amazona aestiva TaxID=12930 RepID=A0A0Q3XAA9_AMAAE|nr:hypothetical protein AAES_05357 [Amazona aestiva]